MEPVEVILLAAIIKTAATSVILIFDLDTYKINVCKYKNKIVYAKMRDPKENALFQAGTTCTVVKMKNKEYRAIYRKIHL